MSSSSLAPASSQSTGQPRCPILPVSDPAGAGVPPRLPQDLNHGEGAAGQRMGKEHQGRGWSSTCGHSSSHLCPALSRLLLPKPALLHGVPAQLSGDVGREQAVGDLGWQAATQPCVAPGPLLPEPCISCPCAGRRDMQLCEKPVQRADLSGNGALYFSRLEVSSGCLLLRFATG